MSLSGRMVRNGAAKRGRNLLALDLARVCTSAEA